MSARPQLNIREVRIRHDGDRDPLLFRLREEAGDVRTLMQELTEFQGGSRKATTITSEQMRNLYVAGTLHALVAVIAGGDEVVGCAVYTLHCTNQYDNVLHINGIFVRKLYRNKKVGTKFIHELTNIARGYICSRMFWMVRSTDKATIALSNRLNAENMSVQPLNRFFPKTMCWRLNSNAFNRLIGSAKGRSLGIQMTVYFDGQRIHDVGRPKKLAHFWDTMSPVPDATLIETEADEKQEYLRLLHGMGARKMTRTLMVGALGAVVAQRGTDTNDVLGMALFHCRAFTLGGHYLKIEDVRVRHDVKRRGVGTRLVAELARIAQERSYSKIGWTAWDNPENEAFFNSLGAINETRTDGWHLYRWNFKEWLQRNS